MTSTTNNPPSCNTEKMVSENQREWLKTLADAIQHADGKPMPVDPVVAELLRTLLAQPAAQHPGKAETAICRDCFTEQPKGMPCSTCAEVVAKRSIQHQGDPVALPTYKAKLSMSHDWDQGYSDGWKGCLEEVAKLGPLHTHADAGEVERLREGIAKHWKVVCDQRAELDTLRVRWSEARTLLLELEGDHTLMLQMGASEFGQTECKTLRARLLKLRTYLRTNTEPMANTLAALSANAEPAAPTTHRLLQAGEKTLASDQFLGDDADTWHPMTECPIFIGRAYHHGLQPVRRSVLTGSEGGAK